MKKHFGLWVFSLALCLATFSVMAEGYEFPLQFTANAGARGLIVAGYQLQNNLVIGDCSYFTYSNGTVKTYRQTCRWDLYGNLLSVTPGEPSPPKPLYLKGTQIVFAASGTVTTGFDFALGRGFVNTPAAHYSWITPETDLAVQRQAYTFTARLKSDGDWPVNISSVQVSALHGSATLINETCVGQIIVGNTCSVTFSYDNTQLAAGVTTDTIRVDLTSDASVQQDYIRNLVIGACE